MLHGAETEDLIHPIGAINHPIWVQADVSHCGQSSGIAILYDLIPHLDVLTCRGYLRFLGDLVKAVGAVDIHMQVALLGLLCGYHDHTAGSYRGTIDGC